MELKKLISKKIVGDMSQDKARELLEPFLMLMRQLMQDEDSEIYLESLNLLKYIVGSLSPHLSKLDLLPNDSRVYRVLSYCGPLWALPASKQCRKATMPWHRLAPHMP